MMGFLVLISDFMHFRLMVRVLMELASSNLLVMRIVFIELVMRLQREVLVLLMSGRPAVIRNEEVAFHLNSIRHMEKLDLLFVGR
jgi:hypothetical protein